MVIVNLVRERMEGLETKIWVDTFEAEDTVTNPEEALREAVKEFLLSDEGKKAIQETSNDFNWGDAVNYVPDEIWVKYGLKLRMVKSVDVQVRQDEVLC